MEKEAKGSGYMGPNKTILQPVPESLVGYVMGRERAVINDISRQTRTEVTCPVKGGAPEFEIRGPQVCVDAACLCILAKVHLASGSMTWQTEAWYQTETIEIFVPSDRVGFVVGLQGAVISNIAMSTGTVIVSPKKGHDPVFLVTGPKHSVLLAKTAIEDKVKGPPKSGAGPYAGKQNRR